MQHNRRQKQENSLVNLMMNVFHLWIRSNMTHKKASGKGNLTTRHTWAYKCKETYFFKGICLHVLPWVYYRHFFSTTIVRQNKSMFDFREVREAKVTKRFLPLFLCKTLVKAGLYNQEHSISYCWQNIHK